MSAFRCGRRGDREFFRTRLGRPGEPEPGEGKSDARGVVTTMSELSGTSATEFPGLLCSTMAEGVDRKSGSDLSRKFAGRP